MAFQEGFLNVRSDPVSRSKHRYEPYRHMYDIIEEEKNTFVTGKPSIYASGKGNHRSFIV